MFKDYEVYFNVAKDKKGLLRLFVESAYLRNEAYQSSQPERKKIGFFVIAVELRRLPTTKAAANFTI